MLCCRNKKTPYFSFNAAVNMLSEEGMHMQKYFLISLLLSVCLCICCLWDLGDPVVLLPVTDDHLIHFDLWPQVPSP